MFGFNLMFVYGRLKIERTMSGKHEILDECIGAYQMPEKLWTRKVDRLLAQLVGFS